MTCMTRGTDLTIIDCTDTQSKKLNTAAKLRKRFVGPSPQPRLAIKQLPANYSF
ncbi:hypothetical protein M405DRAFT_835163, partial [Rhizopogon salebrosus TDB-379]